MSLLFGGKRASESVATRVQIEAAPEVVWRRILFYEEAPGGPPLLLRGLLPYPVRTEGDKTKIGSIILCTYERGSLVKRITAREMPSLIKFEVLGQQLGIESCITAQSGSYRIRRSDSGSEVVLTTNYRAYLHPRWLWRRVERLAIHQLHDHILKGMRKAIAPATSATGTMVADCTVPKEC